MTEAEFRALAAKGYNRIPLVLESFADLDTPLSLYLKLANAPYTFLLESVVGGERFGRYSFIGLPAKIRIRARGTAIEVDDGGAVVERHEGDPLAFVGEFLRRYRAAPRPGSAALLRRARRLFRLRHGAPHRDASSPARAPPPAPGLADVPDILLLLTEELAVVDNLAGKISLIVYADPARAGRVREGARAAARRCAASCASRWRFRSRRRRAVTQARERVRRRRLPGARCARAKEYIAAGDVHAGACSRSGCARPFAASPLSLYRALRSLNPSPYMFYYDFGDFHVVGASPEILVRKEGDDGHAAADRRHAAARRDARGRRGARAGAARRPEGDRRARDAGRPRPQRRRARRADRHACKLTDRMVVERYSHVMHIVSNVEGTLKPGLTSIDVLRAAFPAGTVSGAPKVRAMEIIDELEPIEPRRLRRRGRLHQLPGRHGHRDRDPHRGGQGRHAVRAGGRRHRPRLGARVASGRRRRTRRAPCCAPPTWCSRGWTPEGARPCC